MTDTPKNIQAPDVKAYESVSMGESLVVWSPENLMIRVLNPIAAWMFESTRQGYSSSDMAKMVSEEFALPIDTATSDVDKFYDMFVDPEDEPRNVGLKPISNPPDDSELDSLEVTHHDALDLKIDDVWVRVFVRGDRISLWQGVFSHLIVSEAVARELSSEPHYTLTSWKFSKTQHFLRLGDDEWYEAAGVKSAIAAAYWAIGKSITGHREWFAVLHGAALEFENRLVVMPGQGLQGKTTFCAAMLSQGARYFSDDLVPITDDADRGLVMHPLALPLSIRRGSWDVLADLGVNILEQPRFKRNGFRIRFLPLDAQCVAEAADADEACFVVPKYTPDSELEISPLTPEQVFGYMVGSGTSLGRSIDRERMARLVDWISRRPAIEVRYSDTRRALAGVREFLATAK